MIKLDLKNAQKKAVKKHGISDTNWKNARSRAKSGIKKLDKMRKKHQIGFLDVYKDTQSLEEINEYAKKAKSKFDNVVVIGIGGSALGTQALAGALLGPNWNNRSKSDRKNHPCLFFIDHMDSEYIEELLSTLNLKRTLFIIISKSGSTLEPMALLFALEELLKKAVGKNWTENIVTITDPDKGLLRELTAKEKFTSFTIPKNIGGRFSVFTAVGLLPMALMGVRIDKLLEGCREGEAMLKNAKCPAADLAAAQFILDTNHEKPITVFFPYSKKLERVADWYIQLLAESIGKSLEVGPTPIKAIGPTDQHSQVQLFMEGPNNKFFIILEVEKVNSDYKIPKSKKMAHLEYLGGKSIKQILEAERKATTEALLQAGRPTVTLTIPDTSEKSIGALLYTLEAEVALLGDLYRVDPFNQPGVELGKKLVKKYL